MEQAREVQGVVEKGQAKDWAKLIRKLRWIGMEDEACRLQKAVCSLPRMKEVPCQPDRSAPTKSRMLAKDLREAR